MSTVFASCNPILCGQHRALSTPTDPAVLLYSFQGLHRHVLQSKRTLAPLTALKASRGTRQAQFHRGVSPKPMNLLSRCMAETRRDYPSVP